MAKKEKIEKQGDDKILADLEKKYGMNRADPSEIVVISTGSLQLDTATHIGGTALGKLIEIFGENSCGKSTISLHQMAEYQKAFPERKVALFDWEYSFDETYAKSIGVDVEKLLIYQPDTQEAGYDMILGLVASGLVSLVVIDSQTAAAPKAIVDGEMSDATMALQARINSKFCLKVKSLLAKHNTTLLVISQLRSNIGSMGDPNITTGGKGFMFYADMRWKVWKMNDKVNELNKTTVDVVKSKLSRPFGQCKVDIIWGKGFDKMGEIIDYAEEFGIIKRAGSWYSYKEDKLGQGMENVKQLMLDNDELFQEIKEQVLEKLKGSES